MKSAISSAALPLIPGVAGLPVFRPVAPVKLGSASISTSTGNMLLGVRLAQSSTSGSHKLIQAGRFKSTVNGIAFSVLCVSPFYVYLVAKILLKGI